MRACAVIPAFNEARFIGEVVARAMPHCAEVLVVDDGSSDGTAERAEAAGAVVARHGINRGKGAALATGFDHALKAGFEWAVTLDADLQHLPEEIPSLYAAAERKRADLIIGCRMWNAAGMPALRFWTNRTTSLCVSIAARTRVCDSQSGFRLASAALLRAVRTTTARFEAESELIIKAARMGFRIAEARVSTVYGAEKSKISKIRDTARFLKLMAGYL